MLIRFLVKNLFSFQELTEFNMLPGRFNRLSHHVVDTGQMKVLKLNALYGANAAGKSNLVNALAMLKDFIMDGEMPIELITQTFKFDKESRKKDVYLGIEFLKDETPYYYGITINQGIVIEEELQLSGLGNQEDKTLFHRKDNVNDNRLSLTMSNEITNNPETGLYPEFIRTKVLGRNEPVLFHLKNTPIHAFEPFAKAAEWFERGLELILPSSRPGGLALRFEKDEKFHEFAVATMKSFDTGIKDILIDTIPIDQYFGQDNKIEAERITAELRAKSGKGKFIRNQFEEVVFVLVDDEAFAKRIALQHPEDDGSMKFHLPEESDGTRRLLEYLPALYNVIHSCKTYFIDEIERSIHPLLIKELIRKFSHNNATKGQLIFSTHESNLLDQEIFRPDEIWFAEKSPKGFTEIYSLSEFKEHHTIDIRKGYLNGRYGAVPFLGNLHDLNWEKYAEAN